MKLRSRFVLFGVSCCLLLIFGCAPQQPPAPPDTRAADETAIRKADMDWANAAQSKQVDSWVAFYSDDAMVLPANDKMATGKDGIHKAISDLLAAPGLS